MSVDVAIQMVPIKSVTVHPGNRKKLDIAELAESLKKRGQLQPIIVHALKKKNEFELIAGERRLKAALALNWTDIEAKVFTNLDESEIREIRLIENLQRENLTVWEEAEHLAELQKLQPSSRVEDLALKVGRSPQLVASRLATNRVIPKLRELIAGQDWPLGHVGLLSRVPIDNQPAILEGILREQREGFNWCENEGGIPTFTQLRDFLESTQTLLSSATWALDDDKLVPKAGACNACHKRSNAQPFLFTEFATQKEDRCLDPVCFDAKHVAHVTLSVNKLKEGGKTPVFAKNYSPVSKPIAAALGVKDEPRSVFDFDECKKTDPKAVPVVLVDEQNGGKIQYMKPKPAHNNGHASTGKAHRPVDQDTGKPAPLTSTQRLAALKAKRQCRAVELWNEKLPKLKPKFKGLVEDLVVFFGTQSALRARMPADWLAFGSSKNKIDVDAWNQLYPVWQERLKRFGPVEEQADGLWKEARSQAAALDQEKELKECWHAAVKEIVLPKVLKDEGVADSVGAMP